MPPGLIKSLLNDEEAFYGWSGGDGAAVGQVGRGEQNNATAHAETGDQQRDRGHAANSGRWQSSWKDWGGDKGRGGWKKPGWSDWDQDSSDWNTRGSSWGRGGQSSWDEGNSWTKDEQQENQPQEAEPPEAPAQRERSRSPRRAQGADLSQDPTGTQAGQPDDRFFNEEPVDPDDPLLSCLPADLRSKAITTSQDEFIEHCSLLRMQEAPWPDLNLIGGGPSGDPDVASLRAMSARLLDRIEQQTADAAVAVPQGVDQTKAFVSTNRLGPLAEAAIRDLPEVGRLRVIRAGPVIGNDKEATIMARVRRARQGVTDPGTSPAGQRDIGTSLKAFVEDNWIGTATEKVLRAVPEDVQEKVMQKGPLLGPCPQKELLERLEKVEAKKRSEEDERLLAEVAD